MAFNETCENATLSDKFIKSSALNNAPAIQNKNLIDVANRGKSVGNDNSRGVESIKTFRNNGLRSIIECAGCLVQNYNGGFGGKSAGD